MINHACEAERYCQLRLILTAFVMCTLGIHGCCRRPVPTLVRIDQRPTAKTSSLRREIDDQLSQLASGDVALIVYDGKVLPPTSYDFLKKTELHCNERRVTVFLVDRSNQASSQFSVDLKDTEIFAWSSPYEEPANIRKTYFFVGEYGCGWGDEGLLNAKKILARRQPSELLFAGSMYADDRSFSEHEAPFDEQELIDSLREICPDTRMGRLFYSDGVVQEYPE